MDTMTKAKEGIITMKKAIMTVISVFLACLFCLTGCGGSGSAGKTATPTQKPYPERDKYDSVLAQGDGYYLVKKYEETYNSAVTKFGIVSDEGEWVLPLSSNTIFNQALDDANGQSIMGSSKKVQTAYRYFGSGVFLSTVAVMVFQSNGGHYTLNPNDLYSPHAMGCYFFNVNNKKSFSFAAERMTEFDEGKLLFYSDDRYGSCFKTCDLSGDIKTISVRWDSPWYDKDAGLFPTLSEGFFYFDIFFYTIDGKCAIDLRKYELIETSRLHFSNGQCSIKFKNPGGTVYYATIDKQGNFIAEPHK